MPSWHFETRRQRTAVTLFNARPVRLQAGALNRIFQRQVRPGSLIFAEVHPPAPSQIDRGVPLVLTGECI